MPIFSFASFSRRGSFFDGVEGAEVDALSGNSYSGAISPVLPFCYANHANRTTAGGAPVSVLFRAGGPLNIARFIVPRVVYSVYAVFGAWFRTNVVIKSPKGRSPRIMHRDAATSPKRKPFPGFVIAPRYHLRPSAVFWQIRKAMRSVPPCSAVRAEATAAFGATTSDGRTIDGSCFSARAFASPFMVVARLPGVSDNGETSVSVLSKINKAGICWYTKFSHFVASSSGVIRGRWFQPAMPIISYEGSL